MRGLSYQINTFAQVQEPVSVLLLTSPRLSFCSVVFLPTPCDPDSHHVQSESSSGEDYAVEGERDYGRSDSFQKCEEQVEREMLVRNG